MRGSMKKAVCYYACEGILVLMGEERSKLGGGKTDVNRGDH